MADRDWLRQLAAARFVGGTWEHRDVNALRDLINRRVDDAVQGLYAEAYEACELFNAHVDRARSVRVLPLASAPSGDARGGLLLLMGRCQLRLEHAPQQGAAVFVTSITIVKGYRKASQRTHVFTPQVDSFGSLAWYMDNTLLMTPELIIKRLFEDLARANDEAGA